MFSKLPPEVSRTLAGIPRIIDEIAPVPARFRKDLSKNIRDLSELLTSGRQSLSGKYLGNPAHFSAYLRYFLPWNLFRLCKLFAGGEGGAESAGLFAGAAPFFFPDSAGSPDAPIVITDLGSGPLTLPVALWISMPALREKHIEFRCFDINRHMLKTGEQLFEKVAGAYTKTNADRGNRGQWKIKTVASSLTEARPEARIEKKATLVTAVNVYNELYGKLNAADTDSLAAFADGEAARLASFCGADGAVLIVEPGIPRSGTFIAHIRNRFIERGFSIDAPCTHHADCPMEMSKVQRRSAKWCHFTFSADDAPRSLRDLSRAARLSKEDGVLSFLLAHKGGKKDAAPSRPAASTVPVRITSDVFPVPDMRYARYGCSEKGLVLLVGSREETGSRQSGSTVFVPLAGTESRDKKSGALIVKIPAYQPRR
jgi:hypothetical protein